MLDNRLGLLEDLASGAAPFQLASEPVADGGFLQVHRWRMTKKAEQRLTAYDPVAVEDDGDCGDWGWEAEKRLDALYEIIDGLPPLQELRMRAWLRR